MRRHRIDSDTGAVRTTMTTTLTLTATAGAVGTPSTTTTTTTTTTMFSSTLKIFCLFALIRTLNVVWLIQSQFDPDEYWQNLEPAYCVVFWHNDLKHHPHPHHPDHPQYGRNVVNIHDQNISIDDGIYHSACPGWTWEWKRRWSSSPSRVGSSSTDGGNGLTAIILDWTNLNNEVIERAMWGPVRSFASILPTLILYWILKRMGWDTRWSIAKGPLVVNAILVAAVTDTCVWYASQFMVDSDNIQDMGEEEEEEDEKQGSITKTEREKSTITTSSLSSSISFWCTYCAFSSWFNAYALVRTYSNSIETVLLTLSVVLVGPEFLMKNDTTTTSSSSILRACLAFLLGGICAAIRFTCLAAYIPMGLLLAFQQKSTSNKIAYVFGVCAVFGLLGLGSTLVLDRIMYGFWALPVLGNFHFNVIQDFGRLYGVHPIHWYLTAGIPTVCGMLIPFLTYDLLAVGSWTLPRSRLWVIITYYVMAISLSDHKEFRFLLPIMPMFCLISGSRLQAMTIPIKNRSAIRFGLSFGAVINLAAVLFLGTFHQRGSIDVNRAIITMTARKNQTNRATKPKTKTRPIYRIHFLMGCHSTPLLSHLHSPGIEFEPWYLDCSPDCRSDPDTECESDAFSRDPRGFVERAYGFPNDTPEECLVDGAETCEAHLRALASSSATPDFIVCYSSDLPDLIDVLELLGMQERGRFMNGINGLQIANEVIVGKDAFPNTKLRKWNLIKNSTVLSVSIEDMVLLEKKSVR